MGFTRKELKGKFGLTQCTDKKCGRGSDDKRTSMVVVDDILSGKKVPIEMNDSIIMGILHMITAFYFVIKSFLKTLIKAKLIKQNMIIELYI